MKHIGYTLLENGKPTGRMKALCGAICSTLVRSGGPVCPRCKEIAKC